ncbi:MAG: GlsB/YeaQ/YmgE family stress response membrane protein [Candidatus Limnocylindrales bacterium]
MDVVGWIVVGFIAGALSGIVFGGRTAKGCLPNILIGILGGLVGGYLARELLDMNQTQGFIAAVAVAFVGAVIVRFLLSLVGPPRR